MNVTIRQAAPPDASLISVLGAAAFYEAYFEQDADRELAHYITETFAPAKIFAEIESPTNIFFIIYRAEKAVGYAKFRTDNRHESIKSERAIELQRIYILERVYGTGIGAILLKYCIETAKQKGFEILWLGVWEENKRARRFYEKHGFKQVGTLEFPYGETVGTNLVLLKDL